MPDRINTAARREAGIRGSPLSGMKVAVSIAKNLCFLQLAQGLCSWAGALQKVGARIQWIKGLGGSPVSRIREFNMYGISILRHWAYLLTVGSGVRAHERAWHTRVLGTFHSWVIAEVAHGHRPAAKAKTIMSPTSLLTAPALPRWRARLVCTAALEMVSVGAEVALASYRGPPSGSCLYNLLVARDQFREDLALRRMWGNGHLRWTPWPVASRCVRCTF